MKKMIGILAALMIMAAPAALASPPGFPPELLTNLVHNAPNTGKMLPASFDPYQSTYLLTVASWVSRVSFTPTTSTPTAQVTVNGEPVLSGQASQFIQMTDDPQAVQITVSVYDVNSVLTAQNTYTVYLQRRPSERRTRVSAGYITGITISKGIATISADLVTLSYKGITNQSTFINDTVYLYKYKTAPNCLFYYGTMQNPIRAKNSQVFLDNYLSNGSNLYYLMYIEDEIVAVLPYASD